MTAVVPVDLVALLRRPGTRCDVDIALGESDLGEVRLSTARATALVGQVRAESMGEKVSVSGTLDLAWEGECRRCLEPAVGVIDLDIEEVYERRPLDGDTYQLPDDNPLDLAPMLLEQATLTLPLAPLCGDACVGPAPDAYPTAVDGDGHDAVGDRAVADEDGAPSGDQRWAALDELRFD